MEKLCWFALSALVSLWQPFPLMAVDRRTFTAAVYEQVMSDLSAATRRDALSKLNNIMVNYQQVAAAASKKNADILVFPEGGLAGFGNTTVYAEIIPDPAKSIWNPCGNAKALQNLEVQIFLSCLAKNTSLYIVANFPDKQPCSLATDPRCPTRGWYLYNTNVVYSSKGTLEAKYHKENLFYTEPEVYNKPDTTNLATFNTSFGRFGTFICFDILFCKPPITLIEEHGIGNVVFSTAWVDTLPLLAAIQFHSAFAMGAGINLLAANMGGSGVYTPSGPADYVYNEISPGRLITAEIELIQTPVARKTPSDSEVTQKYNDLFPHNVDEFTSQVQILKYLSFDLSSTFHFTSLKKADGEITICGNKLCCHLNYRSDLTRNELYALGVYDGRQTSALGDLYIQVCTFLRCANTTRKSCGSPTQKAGTTFSYLSLEGSFRAKYVFPGVTVSTEGVLSLAPREFTYNYTRGILLSPYGFKKPLLSASLIGRIYGWDHPAVSAATVFHCGRVIGLNGFAAYLLMIISMFFKDAFLVY